MLSFTLIEFERDIQVVFESISFIYRLIVALLIVSLGIE